MPDSMIEYDYRFDFNVYQFANPAFIYQRNFLGCKLFWLRTDNETFSIRQKNKYFSFLWKKKNFFQTTHMISYFPIPIRNIESAFNLILNFL